MLNQFSRKYPALFAVLPIAAGIVISYLIKFNLAFLPEWLFLFILFSLAIFIGILYTKSFKKEIFLLLYLFLLLMFGIFSFQYRFYKSDPDNVSAKVKTSINNSLIRGVIIEQPDINEERIRIIIDVEAINDSITSGLVLASVYKNKFKEEFPNRLTYGDVVEIKGKVLELPFQRNPGEFDYGKYLKLHGIDAVFSSYGFENISLLGHKTPNLFKSYVIIPVKEHSIKTIDELIGGEEGEYMKGLLLGERSNISKEMKQNFINAGVAHIIAVSGLNVVYVILIIWGILIFIPIKYSYKVFITIGCLLFYMDLTGNTSSIVRAVIMASIFLIAHIAERKPNSYNIISFAAMVILVIDPRQLFDAGFILSFTALLSIIIIYPIFNKLINSISWYKSLNDKKYSVIAFKSIISLFMGTLAAQLGTLPITAIMFKKISIVSLVANLFAIPLSNISLAIGFIMVIFSPFSMWLASVFAAVNSALLYMQLLLIELCAKWDYSFVETYFVDSIMFVFYYIILISILSISVKNFRFRILLILFLTVNFVVWKDVSSKTKEAEITFLYTGPSNSTLVKMPGGSSVMINAGSSNVRYNSAERTVIPYLKSNSVKNIDLLILNSLDKNEFRNLLYLVRNFDVSKIMLPVFYKNVLSNRSFNKNFIKTKIEYVTASRIVNQKGNFRIFIYYDSLYQGSSMMTQFLYGDQSYVFNDAVTPVENFYNSIYLNKFYLNMQVLRVPGSGSFYTAQPEFISDTDPEYIVIGETNSGRKKVNSEIFAATLNETGYNVLNVGKEGAVILKTNGDFTRNVKWR